ncbi:MULTISPECIES: hypothetical protein [Mycobacteriaceae]|uniref:hypothetical protein n=1 Tax=Mycobacteriaceae TaxID=1762 RepID=UPI001CD9DBDA|nr:hypothetical protein [Mycobacterium sp. WUMAC-067]MCA2243427.1 hypothetical protein [Mycobacterium sp. WUMAC-067]
MFTISSGFWSQAADALSDHWWIYLLIGGATVWAAIARSRALLLFSMFLLFVVMTVQVVALASDFEAGLDAHASASTSSLLPKQ